eukprot:Skav207833  [mRNA]  locus=scaffold3131:193726:207414:- [translate_table: standard]
MTSLRLKQQMNNLGHGMAQKIDQLDRDSQEFMQSTVQKIDALGTQLAGVAVAAHVENLEERLAKAVQAIERKAEATLVRRLEEHVHSISQEVETKAEISQLQSAEEVLKVLEESISRMAAASDLEPMKRQLKERYGGTRWERYGEIWADVMVSHGRHSFFMLIGDG